MASLLPAAAMKRALDYRLDCHTIATCSSFIGFSRTVSESHGVGSRLCASNRTASLPPLCFPLNNSRRSSAASPKLSTSPYCSPRMGMYKSHHPPITTMPWKCPACTHEILHAPERPGLPRPDRLYRCSVCRLEVIFDPQLKKMRPAHLPNGNGEKNRNVA